jgi:hypothetical protein
VSVPVSARTRVAIGAAALSVALFGFAFVAAPKSCQWGNEAYFWSGIAALPAYFAIPFLLGAGASLLARAGLGLGLVLVGCAVWLGGLFAANFRIICTLF